MTEIDLTPQMLVSIKQTVRINLPIEAQNYLRGKALPPTLWLHVSGNAEWATTYVVSRGHAWGTASVSSDQGGSNPYPVEKLCLRIRMETPEVQDSTTCGNNTASHDNDVTWTGTGLMTSGPHSTFFASASDPNYGTWSASCTVF